jgi:putative nucleotidyltransferase with HDIG domain
VRKWLRPELGSSVAEVRTVTEHHLTESPAYARRDSSLTRLRIYVGIVAALGVASLWISPTWTASAGMWLPALVVLTLLSIMLEFVIVPMPAGGTFSMATISHVATILLVPAPLAAASIAISVLVEQIVRRAPPPKAIFNVAGMLLTASVASFAMGFFGTVWQVPSPTGSGLTLLLPFAVVAISYFGVNALLLSIVFAITDHRPILSVLRHSTRGTLLGELATTAIGAHFALIWVIEPVLVVVLAVPAIVIARSFEHIRRLNTETRGAVRSLAEIVDHRDATTYHHSERVAANAARLARVLELPESEVELIEQAASVHDLGKIGVPDLVLLKPGPLTSAEMESMRRHTELGSEILTGFRLFRPGANIVRHHHERWDGAGYPDALAGEAIPVGARVVAVVDAFDAMTSDRPYRKALSRSEALGRIADGAGSQWDPRMVRAFLAMMAEPAPLPAVAAGARTAKTPPPARRLSSAADPEGAEA